MWRGGLFSALAGNRCQAASALAGRQQCVKISTNLHGRGGGGSGGPTTRWVVWVIGVLGMFSYLRVKRKTKSNAGLCRNIWGLWLPISRGAFSGVPIMRMLVFWSVHWGLSCYGNYHIPGTHLTKILDGKTTFPTAATLCSLPCCTSAASRRSCHSACSDWRSSLSSTTTALLAARSQLPAHRSWLRWGLAQAAISLRRHPSKDPDPASTGMRPE